VRPAVLGELIGLDAGGELQGEFKGELGGALKGDDSREPLVACSAV
jgi:hypothetical protein